jgi:methylmalonyl-CoA mutase C-terminal domain/subunit
MTLVPRIMTLLKEAGLVRVGVLVGGIIPVADIAKLKDMGVDRVFGPGTSIEEIVAFVKQPRGESAHHA